MTRTAARQQQVAVRDAEDVAEQQLAEPAGVAGESAISPPRPSITVTTIETATSWSSRGTRPTNAIAIAATASPAAPPTTSGSPVKAARTSPGSMPCASDSAL